MKTSDLVHYRNHLQDWQPDPTCWAARNHLQNLIQYVQTNPIAVSNTSEQLTAHLARITQGVNDYWDTVKSLDRQLATMIGDSEQALYQASAQAWQSMPDTEPTQYILSRSLNHDPIDLEPMLALAKSWADWRWPGMVIRPALEPFVDHLVALDPLYLVDIRQDLLTPAVSKFHPQYQRRLRTYQHDPRLPKMFQDLPQAQMGLILAWNYLNYVPLAVLYQYLEAFANLLRPGGLALFTFNDCDRGHGVALAEQNFMTYTPGHLLTNRVHELGLTVEVHVVARGDLTWMAVKKPGALSSLRGTQTLAKIVVQSK